MFRQIHSSIWQEPWFEPLSPEAKLLFLFLICHPTISPAGYLSISQERIAFETKIPQPALSLALANLSDKVLSNGSHFWVKRFWRWQGGGPKWLSAVRKAAATMPSPFLEAFNQEYSINTLTLPHAYPINTLAIHKGENENDNEREKEKDNNNNPSPPIPLTNSLSFTRITKTFEDSWGIVSSSYTDGLLAIYQDIPENFTEDSWATLICEAIRKAHEYKKRSIPYIQTILRKELEKLRTPGYRRPPSRFGKDYSRLRTASEVTHQGERDWSGEIPATRTPFTEAQRVRLAELKAGDEGKR